MLSNFILIAWRTLTKNKLFSSINVFGLSLAMSVGILVLINLSAALDYDTFHPDEDKVYRILSRFTNPNADSWTFASTPLPLKQTLEEREAGLITSTKIYPAVRAIVKDQKREFDFSGVFIERSFFDVFGFRLQKGSASALDKPYIVLMSQKFSEKFFGESNPVGRVVTIENYGEFEIGGIIETPPAKSHIEYDLFISMATVPLLERAGTIALKSDSWDSFQLAYTYVKLDREDDLPSLKAILEQLATELNAQPKNTDPAQTGTFSFELQPLGAITPSPSDMYNDIGHGPTRGGLMAEFCIILVILIAACFNYTNLSIARALTRGKEIGIRKLSGATRLQIVGQYVMEAMVVAILSLVVTNIILAPIIEFKPFNDDFEMIPELKFSWMFVGLVAAFTLFTGFIAGILPALLLSSFQPARILRGIATEKLMGRLSLRKTLLVFQFSLSLVALVFLTTFYRQFDFLATADPGFNRENIFLIPQGSHPEVTATSFSNIPGVTKVGFTSRRFGPGTGAVVSREINSDRSISTELYGCDRSWIEMTQLKIIAGSADLQQPREIILNRKAMTALGFKSADDAVGSVAYLQDSIKVVILGVVEDFYSRGFGNPVQPAVFRGDSSMFKMIAVEADHSNMQLVREFEREWKKQNPVHAFDYVSLDEQITNETRQTATVSLLGFLGFITLSIASLGLLGMVVYTVEVKRKEISIRKIVGASVQQLVQLLSKGFFVLLLIAGMIALPLGYSMSELFLINFVNHVSTGLLPLIGCFMLLLVIGLITILSQTLTAANENPARNLRSE